MIIKKNMLPKEYQRGYYVYRLISWIFRYKPTTLMMIPLFNLMNRGKKLTSVKTEEHYFPSGDGKHKVRVCVYRPLNQKEKLPVVFYSHGGGYFAGNPEGFTDAYENFILTRPCVVISTDYRLTYTAPFPAGFNDCYEAMLWAKNNSEELMITDKFITAGHSAGGGMTAALTLKARDTQEIDIAFQMPIYPMIDDNQPHIKEREIIAPMWDSKSNKLGWKSYLAGLKEITPYAAPARCKNFKNLPPTITFVGEYDPFLEETKTYVENLKKEQIEVVFKTYPKTYHGMELNFPGSSLAQDMNDFTFNNYAKFYDRYILNKR